MKCSYAGVLWIAFSPTMALAAEPQPGSPEGSAVAAEQKDAAPEPSSGPSNPDPQAEAPLDAPTEPATAVPAEPAAPAEPLLTLTPSPPAAQAVQEAPPMPPQVDLSAPDTLAGHLRLAASGQASFPAGNIASDLHATQSLSTNFIAGLDIAFGLSRHLTVGLTGDFQVGSSTTECPTCSSQGFGTGLLLRHHLTQGLRFDPWVAFGVGIRTLDVQSNDRASNFVSLEWLRLQVGGDFFAAPPFGFGPVIDFALSTAVKTDDRHDPGDVGVRFGLGLRAVFDLPGRGH